MPLVINLVCHGWLELCFAEDLPEPTLAGAAWRQQLQGVALSGLHQ